MTETTTPNPETVEAINSFTTAISTFAWKADYIKFCEVQELTPSTYAEEKYQQFRELVSYLGCFDTESLAKMVEAGK